MQTTFDRPENVTLKPLVHIDDVQPLSEKDKPMIDELVAVLRKHNALERIGITLLHQHFDVTDDEVLLETTDISTRIQTIRPVKKETLIGQTGISTAWRLDTGAAIMSCTCLYNNKGHDGHYDTSKSDIKLKTDFEEIDNANDVIQILEPISYFYKVSEYPELNLPKNKQFGLIAQELEKILPDLVFTTSHINDKGDISEFKNINYQGLIPILLKAVKEQNFVIESLKDSVEELQQQLTNV